MEWSGKWEWDNLVMFNSKASDSLKKLQLTDWEIEGGGEIDAAVSLGSGGGSCSDLAHGSSIKSSISASTNSSSPKEEEEEEEEEEDEDGINNKTTSGFTFEAFKRTSGSAVIKRQKEQPPTTRVELSGTSSSPLEGSVVSVEPVICLKLGKRTYFENNSSSSPTNNNAAPAVAAAAAAKSYSSSVVIVVPESSSSSVANVKKTKSASQNVSSIPLCQVEGCNLNLSSAKEYHRKHRVCDDHSKCPKVIVGGLERRFCQQCSRFHSLSEFDEKKRSCRRRLSDHNARRRKPRQETIQFHSTKLSSSSSPSSSFYGGRQQMNFAMNNGKGVVGNSSTWGEDMMYSSKFSITKDFPFNPTGKGGGGGGQASVPAIELPFAISPLHSNLTCKTTTTSTDLFTQGCSSSSSSKETMFTTTTEQELLPPRALSLLSTNSSWGVVSSEPPDSIISYDQHLHHHLNPTMTMTKMMMMPPSITTTQGGGGGGGTLPLVTSSDYWHQIQQQQQQHSLTNPPQFHNFNSSTNNSNSGGGREEEEGQLLKPHYQGIYIPMSLD